MTTNPTPADHATKPSERIRADAAYPDNPVSLLLAVLRHLDAQAMDNAGKSPGDDPLITSPGSACQCGHRCDSHHAGGGHCLSCPCKGFRYYTATRDSNSTHKWTDAPDGVWKRDPQEQEDDPDASVDEGPFFPDSEFDDPGANDLADARAVVDRLRFIKGELWRRNADLFQQLREAQRIHVALRKAWDDASSQRTALQVSVLELTKSFEKAERTRDEWKRAAEKSGEQKEDLIEQRDEAWARIGQLKTELALSTESDLRITKKHNALEAELGGFRYNIEAVLFGSRDEHSLDEMIERASSLSVASANPAASPSGEVAAPSPVEFREGQTVIGESTGTPGTVQEIERTERYKVLTYNGYLIGYSARELVPDNAWWPPGTWVTAVRRVPLTEPEPVPAEPRDDFQIIHTALHDDEGLTFAGPALERIRKERDELSSKVSELELTVYRRDRELEDARGEWRKQETRLVESNAELRSKVSELESENAELSRKNIDLFDEKEKTRATLTATEAKLAEAGKARRALAELFGMVHEPDTGPTWPANWEALLDRARELSTRDAELARVRGELAAPPFAAYDWALGELTRHMANELHESAYVSAIACVAAVRVKLGVPAETPAVAAPAVVQREIMVGSTWADTQGIYADGEVTSYNPQLPDTIRITGASSWSEPVFRCRWRHVSDPPTKESAGKRKS